MNTTRTAGMSHKERLLRQGMKTLYANGFHGTSVDGLLAESGVPKGSFYHHFGSKDAFAQAVLERYAQFQAELLQRWSAREDLRTAERITGYFGEMAQLFVESGHQRACLAGKLSTEVAAASEPFRVRLGEQLRQWKLQLAELLEGGRERGDVRTDRSTGDLADSILALIQGAFVLALSTRDTNALDAVSTSISSLLEPAA